MRPIFKKLGHEKSNSFFISLYSSLSCEKKENNLSLDPHSEMSFSGTFKTVNSDNISGIVTLSISNGHYECKTNLPFGSGAGILEVNGKIVNFIDTLFLHVPSVYGPAYVLSGISGNLEKEKRRRDFI
jgi:hypothetical protein